MRKLDYSQKNRIIPNVLLLFLKGIEAQGITTQILPAVFRLQNRGKGIKLRKSGGKIGKVSKREVKTIPRVRI